MWVIPMMANFQEPLFQSWESRYLSEIILIFWCGAKETFLINNNENSCAVYLKWKYFVTLQNVTFDIKN